jgi:hypothetical protein
LVKQCQSECATKRPQRCKCFSAIHGLVLVVFISGSAAAHHKYVVQRTIDMV